MSAAQTLFSDAYRRDYPITGMELVMVDSHRPTEFEEEEFEFEAKRYGFTELSPGTRGDSDVPLVTIIFVHGLWGHPQKTWETDAAPASGSADAPAEAEIGRKNSLVDLMKGIGSKKSLPIITENDADFTLSPTSTKSSSNSSRSFELWSTALASEPVMRARKSKKCYWPRDLLPLDIPEARILTYGYDADVIGSSQADEGKINNFSRHSQDLLAQLEREVQEDVPIIFCAHSLGGIIVKDALYRAKVHLNERVRKLHEQTKCVVFLGTPHRGSRAAGWSDMFTSIASLAFLDMRKKLLRGLKIDSEILERIHTEFVKMLYAGDFNIHSFQEGKKINGAVGKVVENFSSRFDENPMQIVETIDASHREMARFRSSNEAGYIQISGALRRYITMLHRDYDTERVSIAASFSAPLAARKTIFSVPFPRNPDFVGRETQIQEVEKRFAEPASGKSPFVAIHGLGGIGKSQVALEIAYRWKESFPKQSILWIHASTKDRFNQSFRDILALLGIPENPDIDVERLVGNWLEDESNGKWLMIVDNVDDEDVVFDRTRGAPAKSTIVPCIPKAAHGSVLFTTRYKKIAIKTADDVVSLIEMTEEEANLLLKQTLKDEYKETEDYKPLIEELGFIPLAISHAAAFMRENDIGLSEYMELYRDSEEERVELLGGDQELEDNEDSGVPKPVLATWTISFGYLKKDTSAGTLAPSFLSVMSFMDRQDIPKSLLASFDKKASKVQLAKAIGSLKTMSLISESDHQTFSMHRLVQLSMRRWLKQEGQDQEFATKALCLLAEVFPDGSFQTWKECSTLVVHAESVLRLVTNADDILARIKLLTNVATFQSNRGEYIAAQAKFEEVVALRNETSGAEDIETLKATDALVLVLRKRAKYQEAADLAQKVLEKKDRLLGKDHLETLNTAQILARLQGDRGSHHDAADQNRIIWEARNRILGSQHLDTLESAGYLVLELWELGKFDEAEKLAREVLTARAKILGEEHPLTLEIAGTLGFILEVEGKYQEAEELKQKILDVREKVLGKEHPDFSESLHDMGWILHQQGRYSEAGDYYDHALELKLRILGDNHPSTLTTMCNIPVFLCDQGKYEDAEVASRRIIKKFEEIQGMEHPQTLDACGGLTVILRHQGKLDEAAEAAKRSITGREKVIGKDHPWTQPTKVQHGWITTLQGNQVEGEQEIRKAVSSLEASVGKEHPYVLIGILCLSKNLVLQNKNLNEAEELARRALAGRTLLLGAEHQYTLKCMWQIAMVLLKKGEVKEAEGMCRKALDGLQKALGSENPDVTKCDRDLTVIIQEIGRKGLDDLNTDVEVEGAVVMDLYDVKDEDESLKHD